MLQNINFQNISVELKPSGRSPGQPAVGGPAWAEGLDQMTSQGPFQPQPCSDPVKSSLRMNIHSSAGWERPHTGEKHCFHPQAFPTRSNSQPHGQTEPWPQLLLLHKHHPSFSPKPSDWPKQAELWIPCLNTLTWRFVLPFQWQTDFTGWDLFFSQLYQSQARFSFSLHLGMKCQSLQPVRPALARSPPTISALYGIHMVCHTVLHPPECCCQGAWICFIKASKYTFGAK